MKLYNEHVNYRGVFLGHPSLEEINNINCCSLTCVSLLLNSTDEPSLPRHDPGSTSLHLH